MTLIDFDAARALRDSGSPFLHCPVPDLVEVMLEGEITHPRREPVRLTSRLEHPLRRADYDPVRPAGMVVLDGELMIADGILRTTNLPNVFEASGPIPLSEYAVALFWLSDKLGIAAPEDLLRSCRPSHWRLLGKLVATDIALFRRDAPAEHRAPLAQLLGAMMDDLRAQFPEDSALRSLMAIVEHLVDVGLAEWPAQLERSCLPQF